jgi:hypothetical protein
MTDRELWGPETREDPVWVVFFDSCCEAVIRQGSRAQVNRPDDLGCAPTRIAPIAEVQILETWEKNGERRVEVVT